MIKTLKAVALAALATAGVAQAAIVNTVDLFAETQGNYSDSSVDGNAVGGQTPTIGSPSATILGGYRELYVDLKQADSPFGRGDINVFGGKLSFSTTAGAAATGTVRWDGASTGPSINATGLGGVFLGNPLTDSFELTVIKSDAGFKFSLEAYTSATQWSKVEITSLQHLTPTTSYIPLLAFLDCSNAFPVPGVTVSCGAGGAVDFTNLGALQAVIDPTGIYTELDLQLGKAVVVPEPGALALVGLALAGAGFASRRRKA